MSTTHRHFRCIKYKLHLCFSVCTFGICCLCGFWFFPCPDCFWLLDALLEYTIHGNVPPILEERKSSLTLAAELELPERMEGERRNVGFIFTAVKTFFHWFWVSDVVESTYVLIFSFGLITTNHYCHTHLDAYWIIACSAYKEKNPLFLVHCSTYLKLSIYSFV